MRKHFLILMLLILVSLTGWAGNVTITPHVINVYYPQTAVPNVTADDFALSGDIPDAYANDAEGARASLLNNLTITIVDNGELPDVTGSVKYYFSIVGNLPAAWEGTTFSMAYNGDLNVLPRDLNTVSFKVPTGTNVTAGVYTYTYDGNAKSPSPIVYIDVDEDHEYNANNDITLAVNQDFQFTYIHNIDANGVEVGTAPNVTTVPQIKIIPATNEGFTGSKTLEFTINKADIKSTDFTAPTAIVGLSYNATAKNLINAGTIAAAKGTFQYSVGGGAYSPNIPEGTNAGDYAVTYKIVGSGNYNDYTVTTPAVAPATDPTITSVFPIENVNIAKAMLVVQPKKTLNVLYTGEDIPDATLTALGLSYTRFYGDDDETLFGDEAPSLKLADAVATAHYAINTYEEGIEVVVPDVVLDNYDVYPVNGNLKINAKSVTVELNNEWQEQANYGTDAAAATSWSLLVADADKLTVKVQTGYDENDEPTYGDAVENPALYLKTTEGDAPVFDGLTISRENTSGEVGNYPVTLSGTLPINDNYVIADETVAAAIEGEDPVPAPTFSIIATDIVVKAGNKAMVYGSETEPALTFTVTGANLTEAQTLTIQNAIQRVAGTNVGVYEINFKKGIEEGNGPVIAGLNITYQTGAFAITPATLTVTALPQTLYTGNTVAKLDQAKYEVEGLVEGDTEPVVELSFTDAVTKDANGKLTVAGDNASVVYDAEAAVPNPGIKVTVTNENIFAQNYELEVVKGTLTVVNVNSVLVLSRVNDNTEAISAANGKAVNVQFEDADDANDDIWIRKEKWYTMVLPFETSVKEISEKFGYAVVDLLNEANNTKNIQFRLYMQTIPANKPFIFKVYQDKKLSTVTAFENKTIVYAANLAADGVCAKDAFGNKYIGTYGGKTGFTKNEWRMTTDDTKVGDNWKYDKWYYGGAGSENKKIAPLSAYVLSVNEGGDASFNAPVFEIEDIDGVITSIEGVNIDAAPARSAQGWYTISGMKLDSAPTQSGVYVKDGRKVVIK